MRAEYSESGEKSGIFQLTTVASSPCSRAEVVATEKPRSR